MAYEGLASKLYFRNHFNNVLWIGRKPRIKRDYVNAVLDIGYTILFSFIDALLSCYGFDTYCGVIRNLMTQQHISRFRKKSAAELISNKLRNLILK